MNYEQIISLGRHTLMCADCTNAGHVSRLMHNTHAALLFTSPPYADLYNYGGNDLSPEHLASFIPNFKPHVDIMAVNLGLKKHNHEIITYWDTYIKAAHDSGLKLLSWNVWDKLNPGSISQQQAMFPIRHEFIFVFGESPRTLNKTIHKHGRDYLRGAKLPDARAVREKDGSMRLSTSKHAQHEPMKRLETVIAHHPQKARPVYQPAQMPVGLAEEYIKALTNPGDVVIDPFGGSGTTLIACERLGRIALLMEINPEYCTNIKHRYSQLYSQKGLFYSCLLILCPSLVIILESMSMTTTCPASRRETSRLSSS